MKIHVVAGFEADREVMMRCAKRVAMYGGLMLAMAVRAGLAADYMIGADVSFLGKAEGDGVAFKENGEAKPALEILRGHGYGWVRLRLINDPSAAPVGFQKLPNDLAYTIKLAQAAKQRGYKVLLDYHFSDTWADPGHQFTPAAWKGEDHAALVKSLQGYVRETIEAMREAGVMPEMVQLGNEVTNGILWPDGKLSGSGSTAEGWDHFADLLKAAEAGLEEGRGDAARPKVMIHIDRGADKAGTKWFFDKLMARGVAFDVIGQSFYPWYHGTLLDLRENLAFMAKTYKKDIVVVECAYNWRPAEYKVLPPPFPESPEGQREFLVAVNEMVMNAPGALGKGVFWWEAAVDPKTGLASRSMFDQDANALPVTEVFDQFTRGKVPRKKPASTQAATQTGMGAGTQKAP